MSRIGVDEAERAVILEDLAAHLLDGMCATLVVVGGFLASGVNQ